ncbi:uncharacterized protein LOC132188243 [Corylus avellana]|uniref:uncharacterized protein LOC132188243 n=1 Tax=Corylus avellana TaxID=13451 RepID=UPI00286AB4DF|nr:uncharacterized protein LOC132188243 [Corylus avellana]
MFRARAAWVRFANRSKHVPTRPNSTTANNNKTTKPTNNNSRNVSDNKVAESNLGKYDEAYKQLDKLDFSTAAKILFTEPPKKKKFGIDFHLVQLFFALMPSMAVFLVAQYARYEIRRMEAELEQKKKQEEEEKAAKELESNATEEKEAGSDPELLEVKVRLDKLEEALKGIVVETKQTVSSLAKSLEDGSEKKDIVTTEPIKTKSSSEPSNMADRDHPNKPKVPDASLQDQKGKTQNGGASQDGRT